MAIFGSRRIRSKYVIVMRIFLLNSPYHSIDGEVHQTELLGLEYLAGSLKACGHIVYAYDPTIGEAVKDETGRFYYGSPFSEVIKKIGRFSPDIVGLSCHYSFSSADMYNLAAGIKRLYGNVCIIAGGLYVSLLKERALEECDAIDYALIGEAEESFTLFVHNLSSGINLELIDGLIFRKQGKIVTNPKRKYISNLDALPFPDRDILDISQYMQGGYKKRLYGLGFKPSLSILTSRSCPNHCSFCNMRMVHGPKWRKRSADNVVSEIDIITGKYKAQHVFIMDDNFTFDPERVKNICEQIIRRNIKCRWNTPNGISVRNVDSEMARIMKLAGCANVCIAIESGNEYMRNEVMNKKISNNEITNECFYNAEIPITGFVIVGMPEETEERARDSYKFIKSLKLTSIVVSYAVPFPGTKISDCLIKKGILANGFSIITDDYKEPVFETADFTKEELVKRRYEMKNLFPGLGILYDLENQG
jgi:anaerobic magnesium-protoporphyrin IX monomethyl ester cyclase